MKAPFCLVFSGCRPRFSRLAALPFDAPARTSFTKSEEKAKGRLLGVYHDLSVVCQTHWKTHQRLLSENYLFR